MKTPLDGTKELLIIYDYVIKGFDMSPLQYSTDIEGYIKSFDIEGATLIVEVLYLRDEEMCVCYDIEREGKRENDEKLERARKSPRFLKLQKDSEHFEKFDDYGKCREFYFDLKDPKCLDNMRECLKTLLQSLTTNSGMIQCLTKIK
jgi:hypothetical protein